MTYYKNGMVKDVNNYDYDGSLLSRSKLEYDPRGRVTRVVQDINETQQAVTAYEYSDTGFGPGNEYHIKITDAENKITWRKLSSFGKLIKVLHPSGDYEEYEYNADCTLKKKAVWDANDTKHWLEYYYDDYARLKDVDYPDGGNVHYIYDGFGRKILTADNRNSQDRIGGSNTIEYEYDVLDRVSRIIEQDNYEIEYAYQADGQKQYIKVRQPDNSLVYHTEYSYDTAGRLYMVKEPLLGTNSYIARFGYDDNGNRSELKYYRTGSLAGPTTTMSYTYDMENNLRSYNTTGSGAFSFDASQASDIDGLGRLLNADETLTKADQTAKNHSYSYGYDMHSQLINAEITNIGGSDSQSEYIYHKNGNLNYQYHDSELFDRSYNGNLLAELETDIDFAFLAHLSGCWLSNDPACLGSDYSGDSFVNFDDFALLAQMWLEKGARQLSYDLNGNMISSVSSVFSYNWDGKLRSAGGGIAAYRYAPSGSRIYKESALGQRKFIVDTSGGPAVILLELNAADNAVKKTYIYGNNGEILAQHDGDYTSPRYFYLNDRLGSVRMVIDNSGTVKNSYTYDPFGNLFTAETVENAENPFKYTGQYYDKEIGQYYLRARQYDPHLMRFTTRDPIHGSLQEPMSLHPYLYCSNDPVNRTDPSGELWGAVWRARFIVNAANVRNVYMALMLSSNRELLDIIPSLSVLQAQMADYVKQNKTSNLDPAKTSQYFAKWRVTQSDCSIGRDAAELACKDNIAIQSSLKQGELHLHNAVTGTLGVILTYSGGKMLQSGNMWGFVPLIPGVALDWITIKNIEKVFDIGENAETAVKAFCDCSVYDNR